MIDVPALREALGEGDSWLVVDGSGASLDHPIPPDAGPATILVSEPSDAVKLIGPDRLVAGSLDRAAVWAVEGFILNRVVLEQLECGRVGPAQLLEAVVATGIAWEAVPVRR